MFLNVCRHKIKINSTYNSLSTLSQRRPPLKLVCMFSGIAGYTHLYFHQMEGQVEFILNQKWLSN